jgi:hypothetical protein
MTTLADRPSTALLVIDVQTGVVAGNHDRDAVVANIAELVDKARGAAGAQTDACIRSTLHGALVRGYETSLVSDAHTTEDLTPWGAPPPARVIAHTNLYWSEQTAPGRTAATSTFTPSRGRAGDPARAMAAEGVARVWHPGG